MTMIKRLLLISVITVCLHYVWESSHVVLYGGYEHLTNLPIAVWATIGDIFYTLAIYFFIALIKRDVHWLARMTKSDIAAVSLMGFFLALIVEYKALAFGRWYYLDTMPVVPLLNIGLSPLVQKMTLIPLTFWLTKSISRRIP